MLARLRFGEIRLPTFNMVWLAFIDYARRGGDLAEFFCCDAKCSYSTSTFHTAFACSVHRQLLKFLLIHDRQHVYT